MTTNYLHVRTNSEWECPGLFCAEEEQEEDYIGVEF